MELNENQNSAIPGDNGEKPPPMPPMPPSKHSAGPSPYSVPPKRASTGKGVLLGCLLSFVIFLLVTGGCVLLISLMASSLFSDSMDKIVKYVDFKGANYSNRVKQTVLEQGIGSDKIAVIDVKGMMTASGYAKYGISSSVAFSQDIIEELEAAADDVNVKAIVLDMDTPGGEVVAADDIYRTIMKLRADTDIPVVTCMHSMGASGGYYVAAATDYIIANRMTITGSIGVIMSGVNITGLLDKIGVKPEVYASGDMKDMLNITRHRTEKEVRYVKQLIQETFDEFAQIIADGRKQYPDVSSVKAAEFADGRALSGRRALELGLVDKIGYFEDALAAACALADIKAPTVVRFQVKISFLDTLLEAKSGVSLNASELLPVRGANLQCGKMYFLASEAVAW